MSEQKMRIYYGDLNEDTQTDFDDIFEGLDEIKDGIEPIFTFELSQAKLIAAAPDLLEACKLFMSQENLSPDDLLDCHPESPWGKTLAAIAKAEGK